jgi:hypothetical protein
LLRLKNFTPGSKEKSKLESASLRVRFAQKNFTPGSKEDSKEESASLSVRFA